MRITNLNNTAFSLLEILLASIIFIISITGVFMTLTAVRKPVADKESALVASVFGKQVLEALRSSVNAGTFYGNCTDNGHWIAAANGATIRNANGSACGDFSLYLGWHQVSQATLSSAGLTWPTSLTTGAPPPNDIAGCDTTACLVYKITCGDGNNPVVTNGSPLDCGTATSNDIARRVDLSISWPGA